jgi:hypothetical protein
VAAFLFTMPSAPKKAFGNKIRKRKNLVAKNPKIRSDNFGTVDCSWPLGDQ